MITANGFSKDPSIQPDGIVITWSQDMINLKGGLRSFVKHFQQTMASEDTVWLQKCKNQPKHDVLYVYIIVAGRVRYRCFYGGYQVGVTTINEGTKNSFSGFQRISWPRVVLAGPLKKAPHKIYLKGFQGFRYCTKLF
jgi:hypothetical protein